MATLIFRMRNVPADEADAIRALMDEHQFDWYETTAGNWGIAMPGIWIRNSSEAPKARSLIDSYQQERSLTMRKAYESDRQSGQVITFIDRLRAQPLRVAGIVLFCMFILYVSVNPFLQMIGYTP